MKNRVMNLKTAIMVIPCIACLLFCVSCSNDPPIEPLSDEEISSNLVTMRGVFSNGSIDPELLWGQWEPTKFAFTSDGNNITNEVAISETAIGDPLSPIFISISSYDVELDVLLANDPSAHIPPEVIEFLAFPSSELRVGLWFFPYNFLYFISGNLVSYYKEHRPFKIGEIYSDQGWDVYKALQNIYSFVVKDNELIIYFTGDENKNLLFLKKYKP